MNNLKNSPDESFQNKHLFGVWNTEPRDGVKIFRTDKNNFRLKGAKNRVLLHLFHLERVIRDLKIYLRQAAPDATPAGTGKFVLDSGGRVERIWNDDK